MKVDKISRVRDFFSLWATVLGTLGTVAAIITGIFNLLTASQLAPLAKDQAIIVQRVRAIEDSHSNFVSRSEFVQVDRRLDKIENKVDQLLLRR